MSDFSIFERSVLLDAPASEVYAFHEDPRNITKISPPSLKVERVECSVPAVVGEEFRLRVSQFGLPLEWIGIWEEAVPDTRLVDGARKSPFRCLGSLGIVGRLLDATVMRMVFTAMFLARHKATAAYFTKAKKGG